MGKLNDETETAPAAPKKRWAAPKIDSGPLFESSSLACGKASGAIEICIQNPTTS